jgi:hypothetical protein
MKRSRMVSKADDGQADANTCRASLDRSAQDPVQRRHVTRSTLQKAATGRGPREIRLELVCKTGMALVQKERCRRKWGSVPICFS